MVFPHIEDYVDLADVDAFLAKREKGENPDSTILVVTAHLFHSKRKATDPIEDHRWSWIRTMTMAEWTKQLGDAFEKSICWYP
ncbi:hypothetical protein CR513_21642, partial [Mucuna pruriens]